MRASRRPSSGAIRSGSHALKGQGAVDPQGGEAVNRRPGREHKGRRIARRRGSGLLAGENRVAQQMERAQARFASDRRIWRRRET